MKCPQCGFELINLLLPRAALRPKYAATGGEGEFLFSGSSRLGRQSESA
jgi:hypothetical protein